MTAPLSRENALQIATYGKYYNPAESHYQSTIVGTVPRVVCDRCQRGNLNVCVGLMTYDLCLKCVEDVVALSKTDAQGNSFPVPAPFNLPSIATPATPISTNRRFPSNGGEIYTLMMQDSVRTDRIFN